MLDSINTVFQTLGHIGLMVHIESELNILITQLPPSKLKTV